MMTRTGLRLPIFASRLRFFLIRLCGYVHGAFSPFAVDVYPFIERKRGIVGKSTEAVDEVAGDGNRFRATLEIAFLSFYEVNCIIDELLVIGIVDMSIEHIRLMTGIILPVIADHRVMREDDIPFLVSDFPIVMDPHEPGGIEAWLLGNRIMVSQYEMKLSLEASGDIVCRIRIEQGEISEDIYLIPFAYLFIPA